MTEKKSLQIIFVLAIAGLLFSGYLSYNELFSEGCSVSALPISCGSFRLLDLPACVYGFAMYLAVFVVAGLGLYKKPKA